MNPRIVHLREFRRRRGAFTDYDLPRDVVRVDRRGPWGNPYEIGALDPERADVAMTRSRAIELFRPYAVDHLIAEPEWIDPLVGKQLACWCTPQPCHGEVLLELENVLTVARTILQPAAVSSWLLTPAPVFAGVTARDLIAAGSSAEVIAALDALGSGAFV